MKRLILFCLVMLSSVAYGQKECTTTWPYLFSEFTKGTIFFVDGRSVEREVNVHLQESHLHYLDNSIIKQTDGTKIKSVRVGDRNFIFFNRMLVEVEAACEQGFVGNVVLADYDRLNEATGAYGTTSNVSATRDVTSLEDIGGSSNINTNHMELKRNSKEGKLLYLNTTRYLVSGLTIYKATKSGVNRELDKDAKKAFKSFDKEHKIDWDDPKSIIKVLEFFEGYKL